MAKTLDQTVSINLANVVAGAISAVKTIRVNEQATKEAAFQAAIADGTMSYADQLAFRQKQLDEEKSSPFVDQTYLDTLTASVGNIKKLARYEKVRSAYSAAYADLKSGKENAQQFYDTLSANLANETDPVLRAEMQNELVSAAADLKTYNDNILQNQITKATTDKSPALLDSAIASVKSKRAQALLSSNEADVTQYDAMLSTLTQQRGQIQIQNDLDRLDVQATTKGMNGVDKIAALTNKINNADDTTPIIINNVKYDSAQAYWNTTLASYVSGTGTGLFANASTDLSNAYTDVINKQIALHGYVPTPVLTAIGNDFSVLKNNSALGNFTDKIDAIQNSTMYSAVDTTAKSIIANASFNNDYIAAGQALNTLQQTTGINLDSYRTTLGKNFTNATQDKINAGLMTPQEAAAAAQKAGLSADGVVIPTTTPTTPVDKNHGVLQNPAPTPTVPTATPTTQTPTPNNEPDIITDNVTGNSYKKNASGFYEKVPTPTSTPAPTSVPVVTPVTPTPKQTVTPPVVTPKATVPAPVVKPVVQPTNGVHSVVAGDTLGALALKYNTTVDTLAKLNGIADPNKIKIGQQIKLQ